MGEVGVTTEGKETAMGARGAPGQEASQKRTVYHYAVHGSGKWCVFPTIAQMFAALREDLLAMDSGETFTVATAEMTDAELAALPEFEGF